MSRNSSVVNFMCELVNFGIDGENKCIKYGKTLHPKDSERRLIRHSEGEVEYIKTRWLVLVLVLVRVITVEISHWLHLDFNFVVTNCRCRQKNQKLLNVEHLVPQVCSRDIWQLVTLKGNYRSGAFNTNTDDNNDNNHYVVMYWCCYP